MAQSGVKRPSYVRVGPHRYTVTWGTAEVDRLRATNKDENIFGCTHTHKSQIVMYDEDLSESTLRTYFVHELLHAIIDAAGGWHSTKKRPMDEEDAIWLVQTGLLGVLRDNPHVVAWLTEKGPQ